MKKIISAVLATLCFYNQAFAAEQPIYFLQTDEQWCDTMYSSCNDKSQTIGETGCGPTALAMVLNEFCDDSITPIEVAEFSVENNHRTYNQGTSWSLFQDAAEQYNLDFFQTSSSIEVKEWIENNPNGLIICSMSKGVWTNKGHFILVWKIDETNNVYINDPNSLEDRKLFNSFKTLSLQCKQYFCFNKNQDYEGNNLISYFNFFMTKYNIPYRIDFLS